MACGVFLGILLICFVQAEHVCCLWASPAQNSQKQNSNVYVGFSQKDSKLRTLGGSSPQNQFRQASIYPASVHSSSLNTQTAVSSAYSQRLAAGGHAQPASQPAQSSVRLVQSSSVSKPNWQMKNSKWINAQNVPKNLFGLSTAIISGSSVSKYNKHQNALTDIDKKRSLPVQQGTRRSNEYPASSSASVQSPPRQSYSFSRTASHQSVVQKPPSAAYYRQGSLSSRQSNAVAPEPHRETVRVRTSVTAPARRVPYRRPDSNKPFSSPQTGRISNYLSHVKAGNMFKSEGFPTIIRNIYGPSTNNMVPSNPSYSQPNTLGQNLPVASQQSNVRVSTSGIQKHRPGYSFREQNPSSTNSIQSVWSSTNSAQGAHNLPGSGRFHPTKTYNIPERFGGHAIRRLKEPADEVVAVQEPQRPPTYSQQRPPTYSPQRPPTHPPKEMASYNPKVPSVHPESKWKRIRRPPTLTGAAGVLG